MTTMSGRRALALLGYGSRGLAAGPGWGRIGGKNPLSTRLTQEYGLQHPIAGAGMGFYALPPLVAAISNAGALGVLGATTKPPPRLRGLIRETRALTPHLFGVDFVNALGFGGRVPFVTDEHIDVCIQEGVKVVVFFWDTLNPAWVQRLHTAGAKVWMQVGSVPGAVAAVNAGVDVLIAQGAEAGRHVRGAQEGVPTPRSVLVPRVIEAVAPRLVLAAGGIADGRGLAAALAEGAEGAWVGTRFAASLESYAHDEYKRRVIQATANDTVITTMFGPEFSGVTGRAIRNRVVNEWAGREHQIPSPPPPPPVIGVTLLAGMRYEMPKFSAALPTRDTTGDLEEMWLAAGSVSSGLVNEIKPAAQIIAEMAAEAHSILGGGVGG